MYYLIQVILSIVVITWVFYDTKTNNTTNLIVIIAILRKIGIWPIHGWYIKLISRLEIKQRSMIIIITWQKILPIILVTSIQTNQLIKTVVIVIVTANILASLARLRQKFEIKKIIAISSINNNSWILVRRLVSIGCIILFLTVYSATLVITLRLIEKIGRKTKSLMKNFWMNTAIVRNISGLPPMALFWAKILVIKTMIKRNLPSEIALILILSACILMYHYLWITINETSRAPEKSQITLKIRKEKLIITIVAGLRVLRAAIFIVLGLTSRVYLDRVK